NPRKQVSAQQRSCSLLEHDAGIPAMGHMRRIDVTNALTSEIDYFAVGQHAWRPICHVVDRNVAAYHPMGKLSRGRRCQPFVIEPHSSANITIILLPPKCPELNPVENVWQFMRDNWLSNRIFKSYDDLVDHCCAAWNKLVDQPWRIMSIGLRQW